MKIKELVVEGPLGSIGKAAGKAAFGAGSMAGAVAGGASGTWDSMKNAFAAGYSGKATAAPKEPKQANSSDEIFAQVKPQDFKPIAANIINGKPLDSDQLRTVSKLAAEVKDPEFQLIFKAVMNQRSLSQKQINSVKSLHDTI